MRSVVQIVGQPEADARALRLGKPLGQRQRQGGRGHLDARKGTEQGTETSECRQRACQLGDQQAAVDADDQRVDHFAATVILVFSQSQNGRGYRACRVDDGFGNWIPSGGRGDNGNIANLVSALNGSMTGYDTLIGDLAIQSKQVQSSVKTAQLLKDNALAARDSVSGVNLDEEAANLMFYQQLYDANARVISTADQLFKTLINIF